MPKTVSITDVIIDSYDIEDVIRRYRPSYTRGGLISCLCRGHSDSTPSTKVYHETNSTYCFGCGKALNPISLVMEQEDCTFKQAKEKLKEMFPTETEEMNEKLKKLPKNVESLDGWEDKSKVESRQRQKDYEHMEMLDRDELITLIREFNSDENDRRRSSISL